MNTSRSRTTSFLACAALLGAVPATAAAPPKIWMSAVDDMPAPKGFVVDQDYQQLFKPDAPWQKARSHLYGFQLTRRYVMNKDEATLRPIFAWLKQNDIALAVTFGMVPSEDGCGPNVEGMIHNAQGNLVGAQRLKQFGADLEYINIDEPLTFGHYFAERPAGRAKDACHYDIETLAGLVADEIWKVRSVYPDVQIIEDEANAGIGTPSELGQWLDALKRDLGDEVPVTIRFDIQWDSPVKPWQTSAPPLVRTVLQHGYRYAIIYDGGAKDETDEAWIRTAQNHIKAWEATVQPVPDSVMIQSWQPHPQQLLPETSPTTLPYLVNWYCANSAQAQGCPRRQKNLENRALAIKPRNSL
jgi:hypothetical protein